MNMKRTLAALLFAVLTGVVSAQPDSAVAVPAGEAKIISYNIRLGVADDGSNSWENRREATIRMLEREKPTVFGIQEGYLFQVNYIEKHLPQYGRVGVGRDDGREKGEMMAVFYLKDRYELLEHGDFWLSETPDRVSRGWDGACNRTMTWVHLREKASGKEFYYFDTHFDHVGTYARKHEAEMIVEHMKEIAGDKAAVIMSGDLNTTFDNEALAPLRGWMDGARETAPVTDSLPTFNDWGVRNLWIDHIFYRNVKVLGYRTIMNDAARYGVPYTSDHNPITAFFKL